MRPSKRPKPPRPLNRQSFEELAIGYVGRFATSRARLRSYLLRKLREREWEGEAPADVDGIVDRLSQLGYVDDGAFALARSRSLTARGYGARRVDQALRVAGIEEEDAAPARQVASQGAARAVLRFAERRRLGPYAAARPDPQSREKAIAAMVRAGHPIGLAVSVVDLEPGCDPDIELLSGQAGRIIE